MLGISSPSEYGKRLEPIEFYGKRLEVEIVEAGLKNGYAAIKNGRVIIKVPQHCSRKRKLKIIDELYGKISNAVRKKPYSFLGNAELEFRDGEIIAPLSERLRISVHEAGTLHSHAAVGSGEVYVKLGRTGKRDVSDLVSRALARHYAGYVGSYVKEWNRRFGSELGKISVSRGLTIWGSCSPKNNISINLRLLFLDRKFLDYVVVHELAHIKVRSHSKRFWKIVSIYVPEYKSIRKELKIAGARIDTEFKGSFGSESAAIDMMDIKKSAEKTAPKTEEEKDEIAPASGQRNMLDYFS
ncbi:M48 family metallopeptidase [Candidatus Marsarchaeota archaeon]|jgi:predicted metal-dependent hydrolase|nr:M48 family metallopeptidase [Candidatus Marsarchaeota archaeon]